MPHPALRGTPGRLSVSPGCHLTPRGSGGSKHAEPNRGHTTCISRSQRGRLPLRLGPVRRQDATGGPTDTQGSERNQHGQDARRSQPDLSAPPACWSADSLRSPTRPESTDALRTDAGAGRFSLYVVRRRLGVAADEGTAPDIYDDSLYAAVKSFQRRKGLYADGIIGPQTRRALNEGSKVSLESVLANMEEWRWMPDPLGETYVWVNVPEFLVRVVEDGKIVHTAPVVVGKEKTQTPLFSQACTAFVTRFITHR